MALHLHVLKKKRELLKLQCDAAEMRARQATDARLAAALEGRTQTHLRDARLAAGLEGRSPHLRETAPAATLTSSSSSEAPDDFDEERSDRLDRMEADMSALTAHRDELADTLRMLHEELDGVRTAFHQSTDAQDGEEVEEEDEEDSDDTEVEVSSLASDDYTSLARRLKALEARELELEQLNELDARELELGSSVFESKRHKISDSEEESPPNNNMEKVKGLLAFNYSV